MADISTAVSMARVPILGEDGRISDDYIPAAIGEGVESAEAAATRAETAATSAEDSASAASQSATQASGGASAASASARQAQQSATTAGGAATSAQSAQTAAEAAKTAAEAAQSAAAGSASQAQQSATAAAQSAASVADKYISSAQATTLEPGSQATASVENQVLTIGVPKGDKGDKGDTGEKGDPGVGVPDGGTPGQLLSKTEDGTAWVDPPSGNVLKGTLGPAHVLSADDAYATKPRRLTVYGNTVQNLWVNPSGTNNGVTVTSNGDGSMTLSGTATSAASVSSADSYIIRPSTAYALSMNAALTGASFVVTEYDADGSQLAQHNASSTSAASFTSSASVARCVMSLSVQSGQAVSGTYRIMLNEGSTAEPWCPPGLNSVDELSVVCAGKNLLKINSDLQAKTINGLTFTPNEDGTVTVNGTATANNTDYYVVGTSWAGHAGISLPASDLVFSTNGIAKLYGYDSDSTEVISIVLNDGQSQIAASKAQACAKMIVYLSYANGHGETNKDVYVQLELGSTATAYEPPNVTTTPIDLDGHTLNSLPDGTRDELRIDGTGAVTLTKRTGVATYDGSEDEAWKYTANKIGLNNGAPGSSSLVENANGLCDTLPVRDMISSPAIMSYDGGWVDIRNDAAITDEKSGKEWLAANHTTLLYPLATPQTIPLTAVTLPTLPSPNITVYHDSDVPSDMTVEYERDVTIAFGKLAKQIAGTASAVAVREASTIEEE